MRLPSTLSVLPIVFLIASSSPGAGQLKSTPDPTRAFEAALDSLARASGIPGLSAAVVQNGRLAWSRGFGYADLERQIPASGVTPYPIASLSKPIAAAILMRLVEENKLSLDAPMGTFPMHAWFEPGGGSWAHYPSRYLDRTITVRHVLTHTSESTPPGDGYKYNGSVFGDLTWVIEAVTGESYPDILRKRIFEPLGMSRTLPGPLAPWGDSVTKTLARPYSLATGRPVPGTHPGFGVEPSMDVRLWNLNPAYRMPASTDSARQRQLGSRYTPLYSAQTAAGVISTVEDMARFDMALDRGDLVGLTTLERMYTASISSTGQKLPYGLGWFVDEVNGEKVVWHYGWFPPTVSALYLKVPTRRLTLLLLANSDGLSARMRWTAEGIRASPFAQLFFEHYRR